MSFGMSTVRTHRRFSIVAIFGLGLLIGVGAANAVTTPILDGCGQGTGEYMFLDNPPSGSQFGGLTATAWSQNSKDIFHDGSNVWELVKTHSGSKVLDVKEVNPPINSEADVYHVDLDQDDWGGSTGCWNNQVLLGVDYTLEGGSWVTNTEMKAISAHEFGHFNGVNHVGQLDNRWSPTYIPTMSGGVSTSALLAGIETLTADDWVTLSMAVQQSGRMTANPWFSQGGTKPFKSVSGSLGYMASGGMDNTPAAWISGYGSTIKNTSWFWYDDGPTIQAIAKFKVDDEDDVIDGTGTVLLSARVKKLVATGTSSVYDHLQESPNITNATLVGSFFIVTQNIYIKPNESWVTYDTISTATLNDSYDGAAIRIRIINNLKNEFNQSVTLRIDNARIQES